MTNPMQQIHAWLGSRLDPVTKELDRNGARHVIVAFVPAGKGGAVYVSSNGATSKDDAAMLRALAHAMNKQADDLEADRKKKASGLVLPN